MTPPGAGAFAMTMLVSTRAGNAYTFAEYDAMFRHVGFSRSEWRLLTPSPQSMIVSHK